MQDEATTAYYHIAYSDHDIMNPISDERFMLLARQCGLSESSRVIDIGGGNGHAALLLCREWGCRVEHIDVSPQWTAEARRRFSDAGLEALVQLRCADASDIVLDDRDVDLVICLGTTPIYGDFRAALGVLHRALRPGGHLIIGEPTQDRSVPLRYKEYLARMQWHICSSRDILGAVAAHDCEMLWLLRSTKDEWDRYMSMQWHAITRHAAEHPHDAEAQEFLEWMRDEQDVYLRYQRHWIDWNVMLLRTW
ncbi:MAG: class I SAM-dependent methyltransferase [Bacteroidia bacterium]|nr:class I SAM-dependent methyltransferase [Bacteroidia bacterium]